MLENTNPIFICGYPKSGTTLLLSLLDSHPELLVFPEELKFFKKVYIAKKSYKINIILSKTGAYVPSIGKVKFPSGNRDYSSIDGKAYLSALKEKLHKAGNDKELLLAIFDNWKEYTNIDLNNVKYFVEKTPFNEFYLNTILKWFPTAKFIHIVRDPRDNFLSYKKKT